MLLRSTLQAIFQFFRKTSTDMMIIMIPLTSSSACNVLWAFWLFSFRVRMVLRTDWRGCMDRSNWWYMFLQNLQDDAKKKKKKSAFSTSAVLTSARLGSERQWPHSLEIVGQSGRHQHGVLLRVGGAVEGIQVVLLLAHEKRPQGVGPLSESGKQTNGTPLYESMNHLLGPFFIYFWLQHPGVTGSSRDWTKIR